MAGAKPPIALSAYNHQGLAHETELARRRYQSYERSRRAAAEALKALRAGRNNGSLQNAQQTEAPGVQHGNGK